MAWNVEGHLVLLVGVTEGYAGTVRGKEAVVDQNTGRSRGSGLLTRELAVSFLLAVCIRILLYIVKKNGEVRAAAFALKSMFTAAVAVLIVDWKGSNKQTVATMI